MVGAPRGAAPPRRRQRWRQARSEPVLEPSSRAQPVLEPAALAERFNQERLLRLLGLESPRVLAFVAEHPPEASPLTASSRRKQRPPMDKPAPAASESPPLLGDEDGFEDGSGGLLGGGDGSGFGHNSSESSLSPTRHGGAPLVRAEEALIVMLVLLLWGAAIALFFNRWGKIRMLEPYQPKFQQQQHRASCPMLEIAGTQQRAFSKFNLNTCNGNEAVYSSLLARNSMVGLQQQQAQHNRPRQNSVFAGSSCLVSGAFHQPLPPRKAKSAMDLQMLVLQSDAESSDPDDPLHRRPSPSPPQNRLRKGSILPPVPPPLPPLPPPPILQPVVLPDDTPALLRVTNV